MLEGLVCSAFLRVHTADGIDIECTVTGARCKDAGIKGPDQFSCGHKECDRIRTRIGNHNIVPEVMADHVCNSDLLGAGLVGVGLEPWIGRGTPVQPRDYYRGYTAFFDLVKNLRATADVLAGTLAADDTPVFYFFYIGNF